MRLSPLMLVTTLAIATGASAQVSPTPPAIPAPAAVAAAPDPSGSALMGMGEIEFGGRVTAITGDSARYQRYRDLRDGVTLDRAFYLRDTATWVATLRADHVGYRDQHYAGAFERYGRVKGHVEWNQIPLFYSTDTRTPYTSPALGVFRLSDVGQAQVEARTATTAVYLPDMRRFDLRSRRDIADTGVTYSATRDLNLHLSLTSTAKKGAQPFGASFGFSDAVELAVPIDQRTNDLNAAAEWSSARGMARLAYDGSWFTNHIPTLVWDNPLRLTDTTNANAYSTGDGSAQGRMPLWPDSTAHTVSATGAMSLPARSRAFAYVSVGTWLQDAQLLPHTINTAITPIALPRTSADAEARIVAMNYRFTSRPTNTLWFNAQVRSYDYDNRTAHFAVDQYVRLDGNAATSVTGGNEPFGYTRRFFDADASYTPLRYVAFRAGYGLERDHRTFRFLDETTEHTLRLSVDSTGMLWGSVRIQYDRATRTGRGFDEEAFSEIGEQVSLRQFDISDRVRDRLNAIVQVVPSAMVAVSGTLGIGQERRPDAALGLQDNNLRTASAEIDLTPAEWLLVDASYTFERYGTLQSSRQANPGVQFDDPTRDWATDVDEDVHTWTAGVDLPQLGARTSARVAFDSVSSRATYFYALPPVSTLTPPAQLPPVRNTIQRVSANLHQTLSNRLALDLAYAFDHYDVDDFAFSPGTLNSPIFSTFVDLMYQWRPYDAHTASVRLLYRW